MLRVETIVGRFDGNNVMIATAIRLPRLNRLRVLMIRMSRNSSIIVLLFVENNEMIFFLL